MVGVLVLLVIIYFATSYNPREVKEGAAPLFPGTKPEIDKLEIVRTEGDPIVLEKQNAVWNITSPFSYKANDVTVNQATEALNDVSIDGVVSTRAETQERYNTSSETGIKLKAYAGGSIVLDAVIGRINDDYSHTFARFADSDDTALWRGTIATQFNKDPDEWRDKGIFSLNSNDIVEISVTGEEIDRTLTFDGTDWTYTDSGEEKPVDTTKVNNLNTLIATLKCDSFATDEEIAITESDEPKAAVEVTMRDGRVLRFSLWATGENDSRYLLKTDDSDLVFGFYKYRGEQLMVDYERLKPDEDAA